jgi:hypothetical protein
MSFVAVRPAECRLGGVALLLAGVLTLSAAAQEPSSAIQPTPAEHLAAIEEAQKAGGYVFARYDLQRRATEILAAEGVEDPRIQGITMGVDGGQLVVRFVGEVEGRLLVLREVFFDKQDVGHLLVEEAPREVPIKERLIYSSKQAALGARTMRCVERYVAVPSYVPPFPQAGRDIYLIPVPEDPNVVPLGGFARVRVGVDGTTVMEAEALSKSCLMMDEPDRAEELAMLMSSHLVSSTPVASHVFVSMLIEKPLAVVTDAGLWSVAGGTIGYMGQTEGGAQPSGGVPFTMPVPSGHQLESEDLSNGGPWRERLVAWREGDDQRTPWREDERLAGLSPEGYPDDVPVLFPPNEGDDRVEMMWVRIMAFDEASQRYLGILLNKPNWLTGVSQYDNVVFGYDAELDRQLARSVDGDYAALAVPPAVLEGEVAGLYQGVLHFRRGESGQSEEELAACVGTLEELVAGLDDDVSVEHRYIAHYILGRCLAEQNETEAAIEQFGNARDQRPDALDPQMALLAEYSVRVHENPSSGTEEERYMAQLELVRERYLDHEMVAKLLTMIFDERLAGDVSELSSAELERRRRVGFGAFRWRFP